MGGNAWWYVEAQAFEKSGKHVMDRRLLHFHMSIHISLFLLAASILVDTLAYRISLYFYIHNISISPYHPAMDNPTEDITRVVHTLCQGSPAEQVRGHQPT